MAITKKIHLGTSQTLCLSAIFLVRVAQLKKWQSLVLFKKQRFYYHVANMHSVKRKTCQASEKGFSKESNPRLESQQILI